MGLSTWTAHCEDILRCWLVQSKMFATRSVPSWLNSIRKQTVLLLMSFGSYTSHLSKKMCVLERNLALNLLTKQRILRKARSSAWYPVDTCPFKLDRNLWRKVEEDVTLGERAVCLLSDTCTHCHLKHKTKNTRH